MKYGIQAIHAWSERAGVDNVSRFLVDLAVEAEEAGWEGFFLWDHLFFTWDVVPIPDPWTVLTAVASRTERIRLGTTVTPVTRRRPQVLARQLVTVDQISGGRVILGAGLGGEGLGPDAGSEFSAFGEESSYRVLSEMADEALEVITGLWTGQPVDHKGNYHTVDGITFLPTPVQRPRIPIWIGGNSPGALRRASRYEGWTTGGPAPSADHTGLTLGEVNEKIKRIRGHREADGPFDVSYMIEFPEDKELENLVEEAESVGVTWFLEGIFGLRCDAEEAVEIVRRGPPDL
jgi:alkanesulfonate monooxygenase SsuD/methylene tetrahydromethanopterin reductase-like flavin-dependent oxidoreductase (luciferase family)